MEEWKEYKLGDICDFQEGYVNPPQGNPEYFDGDIKWLRATDLNDGYVYSTTRTLTQLGFKSAKKSAILFKPGTIAISKSGTIGRLGILQDYMCGNRAVINIIPHHTVNTNFVFFVLRSYQRYFPSMAVGSVQKNLYISILEDLKINLPDLNTQQRIVSILKSLDDKIEVNRRINDNLEQQAQALFKSWFVDFEPFKDQPFVESELGMIPQGWRVGTLDEIGDVIGGSTPSKARPEYYTENGIAWLTPKDLSLSNAKFTAKGEIDITQEGYNSCSTKLMPKGTVLFSSRAPIGYITIAKNDICTNQGFKSVVPGYAGTAFIYCYLKAATPDIENKATGSTFKEASGSLMKSLQLVIAPKDIMDSFEERMKPIFAEQECVEDESRRLAELRDTLLPRLMSGELKVNDVDA